MTEEVLLYPTEECTKGAVTSADPDPQSPEISDRLGTLVASPVARLGGPLAAAIGTGVPVPTMNRRQNFSDDIMPYAYPKYSNHPDVAAHVKQFQSIWAVNHGMQGLNPT
jgi:hypothetical protein